MNNPKDFYFKLNTNRPAFSTIKEELHPEFNFLNEKRSRSRGRDVINAIDTIVIHATAGFATQHAIDTWKNRKASAHWIVPDENEPQHESFVWKTVSEAKAAYHVRDNVNATTFLGNGPNVNNRSLGIEIVNYQNVRPDVDTYSDWQIKVTAQIVLYAWAKYPNLKHIISHARLDPARRSDPGLNFPWDTFRGLVQEHSVLEERNVLVFEVNNNLIIKNTLNCCTP